MIKEFNEYLAFTARLCRWSLCVVVVSDRYFHCVPINCIHFGVMIMNVWTLNIERWVFRFYFAVSIIKLSFHVFAFPVKFSLYDFIIISVCRAHRKQITFAQPNKNCKRSTILSPIFFVFFVLFVWAPLINVIFIEAANPVVMSFMMVDNRKCS